MCAGLYGHPVFPTKYIHTSKSKSNTTGNICSIIQDGLNEFGFVNFNKDAKAS